MGGPDRRGPGLGRATGSDSWYTFHVILLPVVVVALVIWHVLLVRRYGVVPPYPAKAPASQAKASSGEEGGH